jgi:indolepyruvate ferredoxin oxidoreductase
VSLEAIQEAVKLNGAGVKENLMAFDIGRVAALAPDRLGAVEPARKPVAQTLDALIAHRTKLLTDYQNAAYAQRYTRLVEAARAKETQLGLGENFTRAVAFHFAKLMAYKDEYEVARLYTNGSWEQALRQTFSGDLKVRFHLAPPLIAKRDKATGHLKKMSFGPWMLPAFKLLASLKGLRGGYWDIFGRTEERAMERRLRDQYEEKIRRLITELAPDTHDLATRIAEIPDQIRGFGHVKEKAVADAVQAEAALCNAYEAARRAPASPAAAAE